MSDIDTSAEAVGRLVRLLVGRGYDDIAATLSALLARCETLDQHAKDVRKECERLAADRDDLRARLAESETYAAKQEKLAIEFSTKFDTAQQQLTAAQARVQELESDINSIVRERADLNNRLADSHEREARLREALAWAMKRIEKNAPHQASDGDGELYRFAEARSLIADSPAQPDAQSQEPHCDNCDPSFLACWEDGSKCRKRPTAPDAQKGQVTK